MTSAGPSTQQDWFLRTLTDRAGAGQSPVGGAPAGAGGAKARERECACASGGAFSGAVGGSGSASPEVSGAGQSLGWRVLGSGGGWLGDSPAPGALHWGGCRANSFASLGASVSLFPPSGTFSILPAAVPEEACPPGHLASAFVSRPGGMLPPVPFSGEGRGRRRGAGPGLGRRWLQCCGDLSRGRTKWGKRSVTLVRALETRTNPAAASEAKFLAHLMIFLPLMRARASRGTEPVLPQEGYPGKATLSVRWTSHLPSPQTFTETQRAEPVERIWRCVKKLLFLFLFSLKQLDRTGHTQKKDF